MTDGHNRTAAITLTVQYNNSNSCAISITLKIKMTTEKKSLPIGFHRLQSFVEGDNCSALNRAFLILRFLILESSVEGGIPSTAAAPDGPAIRPLLFANTSSMISLSRFCNLVDRDFAAELSRRVRLISH